MPTSFLKLARKPFRRLMSRSFGPPSHKFLFKGVARCLVCLKYRAIPFQTFWRGSRNPPRWAQRFILPLRLSWQRNPDLSTFKARNFHKPFYTSGRWAGLFFFLGGFWFGVFFFFLVPFQPNPWADHLTGGLDVEFALFFPLSRGDTPSSRNRVLRFFFRRGTGRRTA